MTEPEPDWEALCREEEEQDDTKEQQHVTIPSSGAGTTTRDDNEVSCLSLDLGERNLGILQLVWNTKTHKRTVVAAQLIDVTQKESRQVNFVVTKAMRLFHEAYDKFDISQIDFILIEDQPDINKQMLPLAYTLREYFETLKRLCPRPSRYPPQQSVRFIHASLKLDICYRLGAHKRIKPIDQWSSSHTYNKALSICAGRLLCRPEEVALIEKYKRTHDLYDCVLQAQKFLELVFAHTRTGATPPAPHPSSIPSPQPSSSPLTSLTASSQATTGNKKKRKRRASDVVAEGAPGSTSPLAVGVPLRMSMPKEQRQLLKAKRDQAKAKLALGTLMVC